MLVPFVNASRLFVGAGETGANGNYYFGLHEFEDMAFILHYLRPDELFIDVGANVGSYTVLASGAVGARTLAFEPVPKTARRLRANCGANGITSKVIIRQICLGERDDEVAFSIDSDTTNQIVAHGGTRARITVPLRRLDSENVELPRAVKIDAEGYDDNVLAGALAQLSSVDPQALLIETVGGGAFGSSSVETENRLEKLGFRRCRYEPFSRELLQDGQGTIYNSLFVRDIDFARERVASAPRFHVPGFGTF